MTVEEYLIRYRLLQHALDLDLRQKKLLETAEYQSWIARFANSDHPELRHHRQKEEERQKKTERRRRLCERYALRISRAIERIRKYELREYARFHFLYGLTHEEIADASFFSLRTVYRHGNMAKKEFARCLLEVSPKLRRIPSARFRVKGKLRKKSYEADRSRRSIARLTARRKSERYRPTLGLR
ncbi:MAG: hypothetical protein IKC69_05940 [Clostridia bacterium]|nr:hypothetical protein [Clostridia bacterium]